MPTPNPTRRAVTLIDLLALLVVVSGLGAVVVVGSTPRRCCGCRQLKDSTQIRGITQALIVWADSNKGSYPLPSVLDANNATIDELASTKDTTGNILSILIMNGSLSPEIAISPQEVNPQIIRYDTYEYEKPSAAARPQNALWDPAFRGTPDDAPTYATITAAGIGHQSYAHAIPFGKRRALWQDTYNSTEPVFANRGPTYAANDAAPSSAKWSLLPGPLGTSSNTLLIHGGRTTWEGNVGYNDNHVNFETRPAPEQITFKAKAPRGTAIAPDNLFVNETDEDDGDGTSGRIDRGVNAYLRPIAEVAERMRPRLWRD
jgi:hypothetical protein